MCASSAPAALRHGRCHGQTAWCAPSRWPPGSAGAPGNGQSHIIFELGSKCSVARQSNARQNDTMRSGMDAAIQAHTSRGQSRHCASSRMSSVQTAESGMLRDGDTRQRLCTWLRNEIWLQVSKPRHTRPAARPMRGPTLGTSMTARSAEDSISIQSKLGRAGGWPSKVASKGGHADSALPVGGFKSEAWGQGAETPDIAASTDGNQGMGCAPPPTYAMLPLWLYWNLGASLGSSA